MIRKGTICFFLLVSILTLLAGVPPSSAYATSYSAPLFAETISADGDNRPWKSVPRKSDEGYRIGEDSSPAAWGKILTATGVGWIVLGTVFLISASTYNPTDPQGTNPFKVVGYSSLAGGAILAGIGIYMWTNSSQSSESGEEPVMASVRFRF